MQCTTRLEHKRSYVGPTHTNFMLKESYIYIYILKYIGLFSNRVVEKRLSGGWRCWNQEKTLDSTSQFHYNNTHSEDVHVMVFFGGNISKKEKKCFEYSWKKKTVGKNKPMHNFLNSFYTLVYFFFLFHFFLTRLFFRRNRRNARYKIISMERDIVPHFLNPFLFFFFVFYCKRI